MRHVPFRRSAVIGLATAAAAALTLSGCAGGGASSGSAASSASAGAGAPVSGGNLTVAVPTDPQSLDPEVSPGQVTQYIASMIFEGLFATDKDNNPRPMLASGYAVSGDGLTYTIKLRAGVPFQNGHIFDSADAVASLKYWGKVQSIGMSDTADFASLAAQGPDEVVIKLKKPLYSLIPDLAGAKAYMLQASIASTLTAKGMSKAQIIGTGPYELKSWNPGVSLVLDKFTGYQGITEDWGGYAGAKHQYLNSVTYDVVSDDQAVVNGLEAGTYQVAHPDDTDYQALKANPSVKVATEFGGNANVLIPNWHAGSLFASVQARQALNLLINKAAMNAAGGAVPALLEDTPALVAASDKAMYSTAGQAKYAAFDAATAKQQLAAAGITAGKTVRIITSSTYPQFEAWAVELQSEFKAIGINATIASYDFVTMLGKLTGNPGGWDITMLYYPGDVSSATQAYQLSMGGLGDVTDPRLPTLMTQYQDARTQAQAATALVALQTEMWQTLPVIGLSQSVPWAAMTSSVQGYAAFPVFWNVWLS